MHISMYSQFSGLDLVTTAADRESLGYTMAHEWGHYNFRLFDEYGNNQGGGYLPANADIEPRFAIMNRERNGVGDKRWLNFSIDSIKDAAGAVVTNADHRNTEATAQHCVYSASCWETLIRNRTNDPVPPFAVNWPERIFYKALVNTASARPTDLDGDGENEMSTPLVQMSGGRIAAKNIVMEHDIVFEAAK